MRDSGREEPEQPASTSSWGSLPPGALSWCPTSWWLPSALVSFTCSSTSLVDTGMLAFPFIQNSNLLNFYYCPKFLKTMYLHTTSRKPHLKTASFSLSSPPPNKVKTRLFYAIKAPSLWEGPPAFASKEFGSESQLPSLFYLQQIPRDGFQKRLPFLS